MKTNNALAEVETGGLGAAHKFEINQSGKMYSILMDKIYQDKPRAIIREICANALDANKMVGATRPFDVIMPSRSEPSLYIRDYGPGLSMDLVMTLYTTFFESTKTQSNDFVGALGLGSKSPFAYADTFTITSYHDGRKMTFIAYKDPEGIPQISLASDEETTEPTGLEICVPVKINDFELFKIATQRTLMHFNTFAPGCYNVVGVDIQPRKFLMETPKWAVFEKEHEPYSYGRKSVDSKNASYVRMGPIAYAVDWDVFNGIELPKEQVELRMPIGSVDILPSREGLSMDADTKKAIIKAMNEMVREYTAQVFDEIDKASSQFEANAKFNELNRTSFYTIKNSQWNGEAITGKITGRLIAMAHYDLSRKSAPSKLTSKEWRKEHNPNLNDIVVLNDLWESAPGKQRIFQRLKHEYQNKSFGTILVVESLNDIGNPTTYKKLSDIELPKQVYAPTGKRSYPVMYTRRKRSSWEQGSDWVQQADGFVTPHGSYYLPLTGTSCEVDGWQDMLRLPSLATQQVFGFTKRAQTDLDLADYTSVIEHFNEKVLLLNEPDLILRHQIVEAQGRFTANFETNARRMLRISAAINSPDFHQLVNELDGLDLYKQFAHDPRYGDFVFLAGLKNHRVPHRDDGVSKMQAFLDARPLLKGYLSLLDDTSQKFEDHKNNVITLIEQGI